MRVIYTAGSQTIRPPESIKLIDTAREEAVGREYLEAQGKELGQWLRDNTSRQFMSGLMSILTEDGIICH